MAAPPEINVHNMTANYDMNKKVSDSTADMLKQQGLPWLVRQAANYSAVEIKLKQYEEGDGIHLDQEQISTGGVVQLEQRILNGEWGERDIQYWGKVKGWNKYVKVADITEDDFLKEGWAQECLDGDVILSHTESQQNGWVADQVWGFAEVDGQRRHVRRVVSKKGKDVIRVKLVYDHKA
ncbi:hypothetical protein HII31_09294 [Pseudocercospora fuligena]|uniref:Uncharacterized protein n=1 Tax=Pseudocercospora fuligena TaxID=685502 RepID=A0A8H6RB25_9PEZI|nr:hypothetical protein HII31_09294 [Pseudocercospora fuligena]